MPIHQSMRKSMLLWIVLLAFVTIMAGCSSSTSGGGETKPAANQADSGKTAAAENTKQEDYSNLPGKMKFDKTKVHIGDSVHVRVEGLKPSEAARMVWHTMEGTYKLDGIYKFIEQSYKEKQIDIANGNADSNGVWEADFQVPQGFGGDHDIIVRQGETPMAKSNIYIEPTFTMSPTSGPVGTEITIVSEGIGWKEMESNWQLTYDNKMTGLISAVSTEGKSVAKIRAAGPAGKHALTIWHGYLGMAYINHQQAPTGYLPVVDLIFEVTDEEPEKKNFVEPIPPSAADGGVDMPELKNKSGVEVNISKDEGHVGEKVTLSGKGFPANKTVDLVWYTMVGNRVTSAGFNEKAKELGKAESGADGSFAYDFEVPSDLGGVPHRIDLMVGDEVYGQAYLRILPSIVSMSPASGPVGTVINIEINGVGWTEYDNAYHLTYDNAYTGYMCGFNSQGTVKFTLVASGEPGYHIIDLYPGIYKGQQPKPDIYVAPQLTYWEDHPGSAIPAIRMGFEVTE